MQTHIPSPVEPANQQKSKAVPQSADLVGDSQSVLEDNRSDTAAQLRLQTLAANSPQSTQLKSMQTMMNSSSQAQQMQAMQARMAGANRQLTSGSLQRMEDEEPLQTEAIPVQREVAVDSAAPVDSAPSTSAKPNNTGLPDNLKAGIESLSGIAMDDVKVHYNSDRPAQLQAHAYAQGIDIHVAPGQEQHLPHEAWHVVQQKQGRVRPTFQMKGDEDGAVRTDLGATAQAKVVQLIDRPTSTKGLKDWNKLMESEARKLKISVDDMKLLYDQAEDKSQFEEWTATTEAANQELQWIAGCEENAERDASKKATDLKAAKERKADEEERKAAPAPVIRRVPPDNIADEVTMNTYKQEYRTHLKKMLTAMYATSGGALDIYPAWAGARSKAEVVGGKTVPYTVNVDVSWSAWDCVIHYHPTGMGAPHVKLTHADSWHEDVTDAELASWGIPTGSEVNAYEWTYTDDGKWIKT